MKSIKTLVSGIKPICNFSLLAILMTLLSFSMVSCGDDDDDDDAPDNPNNEIVGNWQLSNYNIYPSFYTIEFKSNHKATIVYEPGDSPEKENKWRTDGNKLYIYFDTDINNDDYLVGTYTIENGKMTYNCNYEDGATFILTKIQ